MDSTAPAPHARLDTDERGRGAARRQRSARGGRLGDLRLTLLIARRAATESLRDSTTLLVSIFFALVFPALLVLGVIRTMAIHASSPAQLSALGATMAAYLLTVGLLPSSTSVGIAAGQFAGEKEQGSLAPLLASPASNRAIFGGKVLGAIAPSLLFALLAEVVYLVDVAVFVGPQALRLLPVGLSVAMLALVPGVAIFGAGVASVVSSRVRTFNAAQSLASLLLLPIMGGFFALSFKMQEWGTPALLIAVFLILVADGALIVIGAGTWRREEVLAKR